MRRASKDDSRAVFTHGPRGESRERVRGQRAGTQIRRAADVRPRVDARRLDTFSAADFRFVPGRGPDGEPEAARAGARRRGPLLLGGARAGSGPGGDEAHRRRDARRELGVPRELPPDALVASGTPKDHRALRRRHAAREVPPVALFQPDAALPFSDSAKRAEDDHRAPQGFKSEPRAPVPDVRHGGILRGVPLERQVRQAAFFAHLLPRRDARAAQVSRTGNQHPVRLQRHGLFRVGRCLEGVPGRVRRDALGRAQVPHIRGELRRKSHRRN
mmetsp:Transcript_8381/g.35023  ORF Transcript_8381/g.35023 Transcript_8381/m.35023 type:complete len:273 (-) Transcript_8381:701-1519(-)